MPLGWISAQLGGLALAVDPVLHPFCNPLMCTTDAAFPRDREQLGVCPPQPSLEARAAWPSLHGLEDRLPLNPSTL
jgi:hypothetical protein